MASQQDKTDRLLQKLEILLKKQDEFSKEINDLRNEIDKLNLKEKQQEATKEETRLRQPIASGDSIDQKGKVSVSHEYDHARQEQKPQRSLKSITRLPTIKSDLEKFIGENLINKIGIVITVLGVGIGAKYAIDHQLISPLTRILLGYLAGLVLLGFAIRLKKRYGNFSAVLLSGSMAIMYFITYAAYTFYGLFPQGITFALMAIFTVFTVAAALSYNRQVIAHIGLVGAYAVPFLLSEESSNIAILFSYMSIINIGILVIAFKKYWKPLYFAAFGLTWFMYILWYASEYQTNEYFGLAFTFVSIFFATFYVTFLAYKLVQNEIFKFDDIVVLLTNSFFFYAIGYALLDDHQKGTHLLGLFTLCNAIVHFGVSLIISSRKLSDKNLYYFVFGLVLVFITIAIPVQLDGSWVTLLWVGEATLLFWIGRTKGAYIYERLSYALMVLAFFSIIHDWFNAYGGYNPETRFTPIFNIHFLTSILFAAAFGFINILNVRQQQATLRQHQKGLLSIMSFMIPAILLFTIYFAFRLEIANYWDQLYMDSALTVSPEGQQNSNYYHNQDYWGYKAISLINYSLLFVSLLAFVNIKRLKSHPLGLINVVLIFIAIAAFLSQGLYELSELRESYLEQTLSQYYQRSIMNIWIRYVSFVFVALTLFVFFKYLRETFLQGDFRRAFDFLLHITVLWILSSELIHWMDIAQSAQSYKLGLSILWGIYSLFLIILGIWKKKKYLRIGAIILFGVTLIKLFFYDISHLGTISKTIVFVSLGVLLLIISFLYNKYRHIIFDGDEK